MDKQVRVWDDQIDADLHKAVYDWGQSVSWYAKALLDVNGDYIKGIPNDRDFEGFPIQEYNPTLHGNGSTRPDTPEKFRSELMSLWRHMCGWDDASLQERNPIIWQLFDTINQKLFDGQASTNGFPEHHVLSGPRNYYVDGKDFFEKYYAPRDADWTSMLNCRGTTPGNKHRGIGQRMGQIHKDTDSSQGPSPNHFSLLFVSNLVWEPNWGGELKYFGDEHTGSTQWKNGYDIGWPTDIVGNKPGRIILYSHDKIHLTEAPKTTSPEFTQKIAFRITLPDQWLNENI